MMPLESDSVLPIAFGVVSYLVFKKFEPAGLLSLTALLGVLPAVLSLYVGRSIWTPLTSVLGYFTTLVLSIVLYRLSTVHPLSKHPGPIACKISKLWLAYMTSRGKLHLYFRRLHEIYGPIVRVGPNELSIIDVDLIPYILGADGMPKGPLWDGRRIAGRRGAPKGEPGNMIGARDRRLHSEARRVWIRAFTPASVKGYEPIVARRTEDLVERIRKISAEGEFDMAQCLSFFTFDFMGDVVFGRSFDMLRDGDKNGLWHMLQSGLRLPSIVEQIPWCADALMYLPFIGKQTKMLGEFAFRQATRRRTEGSLHHDLFYHLLNEGEVDGTAVPFPMLVVNAVTAIVAGSDTTATVLSSIFFFLLSHPSCYDRLRDEVDAAFPPASDEGLDSTKLANMAFLNGVINEAMRLNPPVSTCLQRAPAVGSGGHMIGTSLFIPEGTAVFVPPYVIQRDPGYFSPDPEKFRPERWLAGKETGILNPEAFIPFSTGFANCIGKPLALLELRMVVVALVLNFSFRFAEGYNPQQWEEDFRDHFVAEKGVLPVVVESR